MSSPETFRGIVAKFDGLKQLTDQARRLAALDKALHALLPPELRGRLHLSTVRDDCLVLQAESAAWATRARYKIPEILEAAGEMPEFSSIRSIRILRRTQAVENQAVTTVSTMSGQAAADLRRQADSTADKDLREVLLRLAGRVSRTD